MANYKDFYIVKTANAFDDTLLMFGVAEMVATLLYHQTETADIRIQDNGVYYHLGATEPLQSETIHAEAETLFPLRFIQTDKSPHPEAMTFMPYDLEDLRDKENAYYEARKNNQEPDEQPDLLLPHLKAIRDFTKFNILGSYNALVEQWHTMGRDPDTVCLLLDYFSQPYPDMDMLIEGWQELSKRREWNYHTKAKYESTALQIYNPASGKGQNRSKADGVTMSNISNLWLLEYLKAVGFFAGALPRKLRGSDDQKTLVLAPKRLDYIREHRDVMNAFRADMFYPETSIRFDLLASVRYARTLLRHLESRQETPQTTRRRRRNLRHHFVEGFYTAFYKDMGNAVSTMNLSFVALPGWITVESSEDVPVYDDLLNTLEKLVTQFDETKSDDYTLLRHLRDFISGNDLNAFLYFTDAYPSYYMSKRYRGDYTRQLSTDFIERIIMATRPQFAEIINKPGFRHIANAIRQATVIAQARNADNNFPNYPYQIRYGLHQELLRKADHPAEFIAVLSDFLSNYNAETARVYELALKRAGGDPDKVKIPGRRYQPSESDIQDVIDLIDTYSSKPVARLLVACGTSYASPQNNTPESNDQETTS